ncbi:MAG: hypothetical protein ACTSRA_08115 [Promethearchaeota archaeon]
MAVTTWSQLVKLPNPNIRYLVELNLKRHVATGDSWTSEGSNTYSCSCPEVEVNAVTDNGQELTAKSSVSEVQATAGSYYFDFYNQKLYVHCFDNDDLSNSSTNVVIVYYCWKYIATGKCEYNNHLYIPLVAVDSFPTLSLSVDDIVEGIYKFNFGTFSLLNPNKIFDEWAVNYLFLNSRVIIKAGGANPEYLYDEFQIVFVGRISDVDVTDERAYFSVKDIRVGTFEQLPINHYWKDNYPRLADEFEGMPIPLFYGVKENIVPVCIQKDLEYTVNTGNSEGSQTLVVKETIDASTPASGTLVVVGMPEDKYEYSSWSGNTFTLTSPLKRELTENEVIYIVGTNRWKIAESRRIKEITRIRKNKKTLTVGVDYIVDLDKAEFELKIPFDSSTGDYLEVDAKGFVDGSDDLIIKGADIVLDVLRTYLQFVDDELDLDSFNTTNSLRTSELCVYLDVDQSSREVLQTIGRSIVAFFTPTRDGKLAFEAYEPTVPSDAVVLYDADYRTWKVTFEDSFVKNKVRVLYDKNPKTGSFKVVERNN